MTYRSSSRRPANEPAKDAVPTVTAKGEGELAERIVQIAEAAGSTSSITSRARSLSQIELGEQIPRNCTAPWPRWSASFFRKLGKF